MQVIAPGQAGVSGVADDVPFLHHVTLLHADAAQVPVEGLQPEPVVYDDALAVDAQVVGIDHPAVVGGRHLRVGERSEIDPEVGLLVHLLSLVIVGPQLVEGPARRRVGKAQEIALPKGCRRGLAAALPQDLAVASPQLAVRLQKNLERRGRLRKFLLEFGVNLLKKCVAQFDTVSRERFRQQVEVDSGQPLVAGTVDRYHLGDEALLRHVVGISEEGGVETAGLLVAGEEAVAEDDARVFRLAVDGVDGQTAAAARDVVRRADHGDGRGLVLVGEVEGFLRRIAGAKGQGCSIGGGDLKPDRPLLEPGLLREPEGFGDILGPCRVLPGEDRDAFPSLHDRHAYRLET